MESDYNTIDIESIDTTSLADKVERNLLNYFVTKHLKPGDLIPKEMDLAKAMGVSRTVIREVLTRIRTSGIIETKKHYGTCIKSPDFTSVIAKSMIPNLLTHSTLRELFELRLILEVGMADLLFNRIQPQDIEDLKEIVKEEPPMVNCDTNFDVDVEVKFHGKLYEITRNETLKEFQLLLLPIFNYLYENELIIATEHEETYFSHKGLVNELQTGTAESFRVAMRNHLDNHFKRALQSFDSK